MQWNRGERAASFRSMLIFSSVLIIGGLVFVALHEMTREVSFHALAGTLRSMPLRTIIAALGATVASYAAVFAGDLVGLRYAGAKPSLPATLLASFCGSSLGNAIGFGSLSGGAVRYRLYAAAGLSPRQIARVTIFIAAAFGIGVATTTALGLAIRTREIAQLLAMSPLPLGGAAGLVLGLTAALIVFCATGRMPLRVGPLRIELPSSRLVLVQLGITMIDVVAAATSLWVLLPAIGIDFVAFATIYAAALGLGVLSHAPGGLGVFEAALLYSIGAVGPTGALLAALLAYRAIYFLLPLVVASTLLVGSEITRSLGRADTAK